MQNKQVQVDCPCCSSKLTIDVLTQTVMRAEAPQELDEFGKSRPGTKRWDSALSRVEDRTANAEDRMDAALGAEREKADRLEDLFDKARDKVRKREKDREDM